MYHIPGSKFEILPFDNMLQKACGLAYRVDVIAFLS